MRGASREVDQEADPLTHACTPPVIASKSELFAVGDRAQAFSSWQQYPILKDNEAQKIPYVSETDRRSGARN